MKKYLISAENIRTILSGKGYCFASDHITVDGHFVGYAYREEPDGIMDSGWRFFSGYESESYTMDASKFSIYDINTIANYDMSILQILDEPAGTAYEKIKNGRFQKI